MKWLLTLLILLTACQSQPIIPPGDPGQIVAHFDFIELPDGKGDTLKCITYSLKNESQYDYYVLRPGAWGVSLTTHLGDTSWCNTYLAIGGFAFYRLNEDLSQPYIDEKYRKQIETVLRPYLLEQRQHSNSYFFLDKKSYDKVKDKLFQRRMNKILRTTPDLTKSRRKRIMEVLEEHPLDFEPVLLKAGSSAVVGIFSSLTDRKNTFAKLKSLQIPVTHKYFSNHYLLTFPPESIGCMQISYLHHYISFIVILFRSFGIMIQNHTPNTNRTIPIWDK